jgi:hypothetical protein
MGVRLSIVVAVFVAGPIAGEQSSVSHPYAGLTYIEASTTTPRAIKTHVIQVDLSTPGLRMMLTPPGGERETLRQPTVEFVTAQGAQAGINGHFFLPFPSEDRSAFLIGLAASDGRVYSACEAPEQSYAIVANAPAINIDRQNRAAVVRCGETGELWTTISGSAQIVTEGRVTIPEYRDAAHPDATLTPGSPRNYANGNSWYAAVNARSVIGLSRDNRTLTLFTVDARGGSEGMTVSEAAAWVIEKHGVWNALNIDGGGSTSLALADPLTGVVSLVNTSSDNPKGRSVASSLAVFAAKVGGR